MDITTEELKNRLDNGEDILIIDVREPHEYEEYNMGAKLIPLGTLPQALEELQDLKDTEIVIHCKSGTRSGNAKAYMQSVGFTNVRNLLGGITEWKLKFDA